MFDPVPFPSLILQRSIETPDAPFLVDAPRDECWSYERTYRRALQWQSTLRSLGAEHGDTVATMLLNEPESVAVWLGISYAGSLEVPGNVDYRGSLLDHYLRLSGAKIVVAIPSCVVHLVAAAERIGRELTIIVVGSAPEPCPRGVRAMLDLPELAVAPTVGTVHTSSLHEVCSVMFTSGTTGPSKGVMIPWMQLHESACGWMPLGGMDPDGRNHSRFYVDLDPCYYSPYPFHHMASRAPVHLMALLGGRIVLRPHFKTDLFWPEVRKYGCTSTELLGTMALFLNNADPQPDDADNPMQSIMIVPLISNFEEFGRRFGARIWTVYNMTELSVPIVSSGYQLDDFRASGKARPGYQLRIVDEFDMPVPTGEIGELLVRADRPWALLSGYLDMPEATAKAFSNLWFHTGDGFRTDDAGNFYFVDRLKDTIRRRGENISSIELENEVMRIGEFAGAVAIGVPSDVGEEDVKVLAIRRAGSSITESEFIAAISEVVPRFMVPRYVEWAEDFPRTPTQKVQKAELRRIWRNGRTWDAKSQTYLQPEGQS